jgi:SAM-dependent methyltransferase
VPPLPSGRFDVVLLLETMLAFRDKRTLIEQVGAALAPGGRFAFTLEAGEPLTAAERAAMPNADTVWPAPLDEVRAMALDAGLEIRWEADHTGSHAATARALHDAFAADGERIEAVLGRQALDDLCAAHSLWAAWLASGRVRKIAVVAERG